MNLDKMRRNLARNVPDAVWRTLDFMNEDDYTRGYDEWCAWFLRMMKIKHGANVRGITAFQSDETYGPLGSVRAQLVVNLYDPTRRHGSRRTVNPIVEANKREFEKELVTPFEFRKRIIGD